jgi:hypothetical protein
VSHFLGKHTLKLPSHLAVSRHGIFYFRLTVRCGSTTREKRWSLKTRDPAQAKIKALGISAAIKGAQMSSAYDPKMFNLDDMSTWPTDEQLQKAVAQNDAIAQVLLDMKRQSKSNPSSKPISKLNPNGADFAENLRSLQIKIGNTTLIADPNDPADLKAAREIAQALMQPSHEPDHTSLISAGPVSLASGAADVLSTPSAPVSGSQRNLAGLTLDELITRYATLTCPL